MFAETCSLGESFSPSQEQLLLTPVSPTKVRCTILLTGVLVGILPSLELLINGHNHGANV